MVHELYSIVKEHNQQLLADDASVNTFGVSIILFKKYSNYNVIIDF